MLQSAMNAEADTAGITGTILDRTVDLLTVEDDRTTTIYCVSASPAPSADLVPGVRVNATGRFEAGILAARLLRPIGGDPWPATAEAPPEPPGVTHVLILMQGFSSFASIE